MKRIMAIIALLSLSTAAWAQVDYSGESSMYDRYVTFNVAARYGVAFPMGGQKDYIDKISPTNFALEGEWLFPRRFSIGLKTGYQYSKLRTGRQVYSYTDGDFGQDISAVQTRTLSIIPAMASLSYYFAGNADAIRPYIQFAGGGAYVNYTNYFGTLADQKTQFAGAIAPAIGLKYYGAREQRLGAEIQAQYQNVFFNYDLLKNSAPSLMISAGISYRFY
ncbi:hypothetical protein [Spirosoma sp.]|uniref:hypothetical protein n=1 Tax=Spirosoma sp. TaxID=1899569 RepID=UPI003B3BBCE9